MSERNIAIYKVTKQVSIARGWKSIVFSSVLALATLSCSAGKRPFETARICLGSPSEVIRFTELLKKVARSESMEFFDRSSETLRERKALSSSNPDVRNDDFVINVGVLDTSGMGVSASDLIGQGYQVALGFSDGRDRSAAERFATTLIGQLKKRWKIDIYSDGAGVKPAARCEVQ